MEMERVHLNANVGTEDPIYIARNYNSIFQA